MKKELLILVIFFLSLYSISADTDCSDFEASKQSSCASLTNADQYCYYDSDTDVCQTWYQDCTEYHPTSGFDENICKKITIPITASDYDNKKCGVVTDSNGNKSCQRVYKECNELLTQDLCISNLDFGLGTDKRCVWSEDKCELHYKSCTNDNIKTNQNKCITNIPDGNDKKCVWKENACNEEVRKCTDFIEYYEYGKRNLACNKLNHDDGKICFEDPDEEKCIETYKECGGIALGTSCTNIKPLYETSSGSGEYYINYNKICKVNADNENKCEPADRSCEEYLGQDDQTCERLKPKGEDTICFYDETQKKCTETYEKCGNKDMEEAACTKLSPIYDNLVNSIHHYYIDYKMKCALDADSKCNPTERICHEFVEGGNADCTELKSEKDPNRNKARCYLIDDSCKDMYDKCENFNDLITTENRDKNKINCTSNMAVPESGKVPTDSFYYKCSFDDDEKKCTTEKKACEEIKDLTKCTSHVLDDADQMCIVNGNECKQVYRTCQKYDDKYSSNRAQITKNDCELIPIFREDSKSYKCVYSDSPNKKCEKKEINCEDYTGNLNTECEAMLANDTSLYKCAFVNNKCVTQYIDCSTYNTQILTKDEKTYKDNCETIVLTNSYHRCFVEKDKQCVEKAKICSDYTGEDEEECSKYSALDSKYSCVIENKKCVEKFVPQENYYYFCSDYKGTDQKFCQSIQPHIYSSSSNTISYTPDYSSKCIYENGCTKVSKKCNEAKDETECALITPDDDDKTCIYKSGCVEQYKSCKKYEDNEETINQNTCESIIIVSGQKETEDGTTLDPIKYRCKYTAGTSGAKGTCRAQLRTCSEFTPDLIKGSCSGIDLADASKKCVFSNNKCSSPTQKTCMELIYISPSDANSDICEEAKTSSTDKKCVLYNHGCREYTNLDDPFDPILQQQTETQQNNNSANFRLNILLFLFLSILL